MGILGHETFAENPARVFVTKRLGDVVRQRETFAVLLVSAILSWWFESAFQESLSRAFHFPRQVVSITILGECARLFHRVFVERRGGPEFLGSRRTRFGSLAQGLVLRSFLVRLSTLFWSFNH